MAQKASLRQYNGGDSNVPSLVLDVYLGWEGVREGVKILTRVQSHLYSSYICSLYSFLYSFLYSLYSRIGPNTMTQQIKLI